MLKLWTHSRDAQARGRILAIYDRVLQEHVMLDAPAFRWLSRALNKALPPEQAFQRVDVLLSRMVAFGQVPDSKTWAAMLQSTALSDSKNRLPHSLVLYRKLQQARVPLTQEIVSALLTALGSGATLHPASARAVSDVVKDIATRERGNRAESLFDSAVFHQVRVDGGCTHMINVKYPFRPVRDIVDRHLQVWCVFC